MITELRKRISSRLHLWGALVHDDFHTIKLTAPDGAEAEFACYYQWTGTWPAEWQFDCDCPERG